METYLNTIFPIIIDTKIGDCSRLKSLLSMNKGYNINNNDRQGMAPIHIALLYGNDTCVDLLLKYILTLLLIVTK